MINKTVSSCKYCMRSVRIIVLTGLKYNVRFFADYIPTHENKLADSLSRLEFRKFWNEVPSIYNVPESLLPPKHFFLLMEIICR